MGIRKNWLAGVADVELMFSKYDNENNYLVHNCFYKIPSFLKSIEFDAIIIMSTFMDKFIGNFTKEEQVWIDQYEFLKKTRAKKIVFAQDDYWFSDLRDSFYINYNIDLVHLVCPPECWSELVPRFIAKGGNIKQGFTTYFTPYIKSLIKFKKDWKARKFDVVYRSTRHPKVPNKIGELKGIIGDLFLDKIPRHRIDNMNLDLGNDGKAITGESWYEYVADSRAILGSNSGSSILLRNNDVRKQLLNYKKLNPDKSASEIETAVLPVGDRAKNYTAISPRNLEAAVLGTVQVLVNGSYSDMLMPNRDYIPLNADGSNAGDILDTLDNLEICNRITSNCESSLLNNQKLDGMNIISETINFIKDNKMKSSNLNYNYINLRYKVIFSIEFLFQYTKLFIYKIYRILRFTP